MLRAFLFIAAITFAADQGTAQELDGRLKQILRNGTIKLPTAWTQIRSPSCLRRDNRMVIQLIFANLSRVRSNVS